MAIGLEATEKYKCCVANYELCTEREVPSWQQNILYRMEQRWAALTTEPRSSDLIPIGVDRVKR
jgi:hypothetical protein